MSKKHLLKRKTRVSKFLDGIGELSKYELENRVADLKKARGFKDGFAPHEQASDIDQEFDSKIPDPKGWVLPKNFCPQCDRTDITDDIGLDGKIRKPNPGMSFCSETRPDLDLEIGDIIFYFICYGCAHSTKWEGTTGIWLPNGDWHASEEDKTSAIRERVYDWIRAAKLRGLQPIRGAR